MKAAYYLNNQQHSKFQNWILNGPNVTKVYTAAVQIVVTISI
jgi:hypothetical protein